MDYFSVKHGGPELQICSAIVYCNAFKRDINLAKKDWMEGKSNQHKPFSMANYKTLYNNTLILELFIRKFAINPNTAKNQKIVQELLEYGKIAA